MWLIIIVVDSRRVFYPDRGCLGAKHVSNRGFGTILQKGREVICWLLACTVGRLDLKRLILASYCVWLILPPCLLPPAPLPLVRRGSSQCDVLVLLFRKQMRPMCKICFQCDGSGSNMSSLGSGTSFGASRGSCHCVFLSLWFRYNALPLCSIFSHPSGNGASWVSPTAPDPVAAVAPEPDPVPPVEPGCWRGRRPVSH